VSANINSGNIKSLMKNESTGYFSVRLDVGKKAKKITYQIHQLVAQMFIGECPPKHNVCHIDGNKENNKVSNLKYMSQSNSMNRYFEVKQNKTENKSDTKQIDITKLIGGTTTNIKLDEIKPEDKL